MDPQKTALCIYLPKSHQHPQKSPVDLQKRPMDFPIWTHYYL